MKDKFKIFKHRHSDNLHLRLTGEFNDISVCELIDVLKDNYHEVMNVFIHTSNLNTVSASDIARDVFSRNIRSMNDNRFSIQFTGGCESQLVPMEA